MMISKKTVALFAACTLVLAACDRKNQQQSNEPELNTPPTVVPVALNCDDASIKNNLVRTLSAELDKSVVALSSNYADAAALELERRARQRVAGFGVDLQRVSEDNGQCVAELHITLPMTDVNYANREFARANKPSLAEQAAALGVTINNDNYIVAPVSYRVTDGAVSLASTPAVLELLAQLATGSAYALANDEQRVNLAGRPVPTVRPLPPAEIVRPTPVPREETTAPTTDSQDPLVREFQERTATNTDSANTGGGTSSNSAAATQNTAPVTDKSVEITIVETDDTY